MAIDITYDSQVIASAEPGQTATLSCANMKMKTDIGVAIPADYIIPSGEIEITEAGQYDIDVTTAKTAKVNVAGAEYNIHYDRDIAPTDKTKLWVQTPKPEELHVMVYPEPYGTDTTKTNGAILPASRTYLTCATVGNKVYMFGGQSPDEAASVFETVFNKNIYVFDYTTNEITTLNTQMPTGSRFDCAAVGDKIYIFGGFYDTDTPVLIFDTVTEEITSVAGAYTVAKYETRVAAVGTKIYIFGGRGGTYNASTKRVSLTGYYDTIQMFDTETNELTTLDTVLPAGNSGMAVGVVDTKIYLFGGMNHEKSICIFDTESQTLEVLEQTLPVGMDFPQYAVIGSKIYLYRHNSSSAPYRVWVFDTETLKIVKLLTKIQSGSTGVNKSIAIGSTIYLFGMWDANASSYQNTITFDTRVGVSENHLAIEESLEKNRFYITPEIRIGVNNLYYGNAEGLGKKVNGALYNGSTWQDFISPVITAKHYKQSIKLDEGVSYSGFNCNVGDLVVAYFTSSYEVTLTDGWMMLAASETLSSTTTMKAYWVYKFAESTSITIEIDIGDERTVTPVALLIPGATGVTFSGNFIYKEGTETRGITVDKPEGLVLWGVFTGSHSNYFTCSTKDVPVVSSGTGRFVIPDGSDRETVEFYCKGYQDTPIVVSCLTVEGIDKLYDTVFDED